MNVAQRIGQQAINEKWPPELLALVLDRTEAAGVDLQSTAPIESWDRWYR